MRSRPLRPLAALLVAAALLVPAAASADGKKTLVPSPPHPVRGGFGAERVSYGKGSGAQELTRYLLFAEAEIPRYSLLGEDRFSFLLGAHAYELEEGDLTSPSIAAGVTWRGVFAPAAAGDGPGGGYLRRWRIEGLAAARLFDAPEGPAGTAFDVTGEVRFRRAVGNPVRPWDAWFGPSLRYGILPVDRVRVGDNNVRFRYEENETTSPILRAVGVTVGAEIPLGKGFLLRPEARVAADFGAYVSLQYIPPPDKAAPAPAEPAPQPVPAPAPAGESSDPAKEVGDAPPVGGAQSPAAGEGEPSPPAEGGAPTEGAR